MVRRSVAATVAAALAAILGGCGDDELRGSAGTQRAAAPAAAVRDRPAAAPARALAAFVDAARARDSARVWSLLSLPTRASFGGTLGEFRGGAALELHQLFETLRGERVILSRTVGERWAVAALAGRRTVRGETDAFAYGAALVRERGAWKIDLGGAVLSGLSPEPLEEVDARPRVEVDVSGAAAPSVFRLWLDGEPVEARRDRVAAFSASFSGRPGAALPPGRHDAVAFAATPDAAVAVAWPFVVKR